MASVKNNWDSLRVWKKSSLMLFGENLIEGKILGSLNVSGHLLSYQSVSVSIM